MTERVAPGVVYTTFHHPETQANVITTDYSDWATNCPEYKVTAVQVMPSNGPSDVKRRGARPGLLSHEVPLFGGRGLSRPQPEGGLGCTTLGVAATDRTPLIPNQEP